MPKEITRDEFASENKMDGYAPSVIRSEDGEYTFYHTTVRQHTAVTFYRQNVNMYAIDVFDGYIELSYDDFTIQILDNGKVLVKWDRYWFEPDKMKEAITEYNELLEALGIGE